MGRKSKRHVAQVANLASKRSPRHRQHSSRGIKPLFWIGGAAGLMVILLVLNAWRSGAFARLSVPSRSEDPVSLLPLAEAEHPLQGGHDMALIPQETPAPRPTPAGVPVPRLDMSSTRYDFGHIYEQWDVTHVFAVQNTGDADLVIDNLVTSCGCTTAELSSSVIPPGQRADLTVTFDADFHETQGEVVRLVWFGTNDPTQPWVEVRITADVR